MPQLHVRVAIRLLCLVLMLVTSSCTAPRHGAATDKVNEDPNADRGPFKVAHLKVTGGEIELRISAGERRVTDEEITAWVQTAANAVAGYFGAYPVQEVRITIRVGGRGKIDGGVANTDGIHVKLGSETRAADLQADWVMTHEMFHLAFPSLDDDYEWLREGLASYLEPLARARMGTLDSKKVWADYYEGMPQGQPEAGDKGLDQTHTWGRTYWGGALFCLLADVQIRERTAGRKSLDEAMRAILQKGGDNRHHWTLARVIQEGDAATGTAVLHDLHEQMGNKPVTVDLEAFWRRLGVMKEGGRVVLNDDAPLAGIRRAMTEPRRSEASIDTGG